MAEAMPVSDAARGKVRRTVPRVVLLVAASVLLSSCWLQPGWGPHRSGHNPDERGITRTNVASLTEVWSSAVGDAPVSDPVVSTEGVHTVAGTWVRTTRLRDGAERWVARVQPCPDECPWDPAVGPPSVWNGQVLVPWFFGHGGGVLALDGSTGAWLDPVHGGAGGVHPVSVNGDTLAATSEVYCGQCYAAFFSVFDPTDPSRNWRTTFLETSRSTAPTFAEDRVVFGLGGRRLVAFTIAPPTDCHPDYPVCPPLWSFDLQGDVTAPVVSDDGRTVYVGDTSGRVMALAASDGSVRWSARLGGEGTPQVLAPPTVGGGRLYVPSSDGRVYVFAADGCGQATCAPVWAASTGSPVTTQAGLAGGVLYVGSDDGTIHAFAADGCDSILCLPVWETATGSRITGAPTIALGTLLVGTEDGRLVAYRPS